MNEGIVFAWAKIPFKDFALKSRIGSRTSERAFKNKLNRQWTKKLNAEIFAPTVNTVAMPIDGISVSRHLLLYSCYFNKTALKLAWQKISISISIVRDH